MILIIFKLKILLIFSQAFENKFPSFDLSFSLNFHNMVDFWALPHLLWLWLFLFFFRKKKKTISLIKSPGADSGFAFFWQHCVPNVRHNLFHYVSVLRTDIHCSKF